MHIKTVWIPNLLPPCCRSNEKGNDLVLKREVLAITNNNACANLLVDVATVPFLYATPLAIVPIQFIRQGESV